MALDARGFDEIRGPAPGSVMGEHGPEEPALVIYEVPGRHAAEFTTVIERNG